MDTTSLPALRYLDMRLIALADEPGLAHVECSGAIVLPDFQPEREPLAELLGAGAYERKIILNLSRADCLDTSGVSWLVYCHESCRKAGGILVLHAIPPRVRHILQLLRMDQWLHIVTDFADAQAFAATEKP
jgi:anti-anti-sigma factor